jgi:hypothetical protein
MRALRNAVLVFILFNGYSVYAQQQFIGLPEAPSRQHKFFDTQNKIAYGTLAGLIAVDAYTTQRLTNSGVAHEANPLWKPMVRQGWQGEMAASALGFSAALGVGYSFHKMGHHKIERWVNWLGVAMEAGVDANNLALYSRR